MLKEEWDAESNGKLPHLLIPSKTATSVPEFAMEDLRLGRIAALVPEFAAKDLPLGRTLMIIHLSLEENTKNIYHMNEVCTIFIYFFALEY